MRFQPRYIRKFDTYLDDVQRAGVLDEAADAATAARRLDAAEEWLRELVDAQSAAGDERTAARTRARLASVLLSGQRNEAALAEVEAAMRSVRTWHTDAPGVELAAQLARAWSIRGRNTTRRRSAG